MAWASHRLKLKGGYEGLYAPLDGFTTPVPRFKNDIAALMQLMDFVLPPLWVVRPMDVVQVFYDFGDASGKQFGATLSENYNCQGCLSRASASSNRV
jgi:hypothetical protein